MGAIKRIGFLLLMTVVLWGCSEKHDTYYLGYIEGKYVYLSSKISGHLVKLDVAEGQQVKAGALAYQLDPQPELAQLEAAKATLRAAEFQLVNLEKGKRLTVLKRLEANITQAQVNLAFSKKMLIRNEKLRKQRAIGQAALDRSRTSYEENLEKLKAAEADLSDAKLGARVNEILGQKANVEAALAEVVRVAWRLAQKTMSIPEAGMISRTFYRPGEFVAAGSPVVELLPPSERKLIFYAPEKLLSQLQMGTQLMFRCDGCKKAYHASIDFISPQAQYTPPVIYSRDSREKLVYLVEAKIDPSIVTQFNPGQPVEVSIK